MRMVTPDLPPLVLPCPLPYRLALVSLRLALVPGFARALALRPVGLRRAPRSPSDPRPSVAGLTKLAALKFAVVPPELGHTPLPLPLGLEITLQLKFS